MASMTGEVTPVGIRARTNSGMNKWIVWVCPSISPGTRVRPEASSVSAPGGTDSEASTTRAIRPSLTQTERPGVNSPVTASKTVASATTVSGGSSPKATRTNASLVPSPHSSPVISHPAQKGDPPCGSGSHPGLCRPGHSAPPRSPVPWNLPGWQAAQAVPASPTHSSLTTPLLPPSGDAPPVPHPQPALPRTTAEAACRKCRCPFLPRPNPPSWKSSSSSLAVSTKHTGPGASLETIQVINQSVNLLPGKVPPRHDPVQRLSSGTHPFPQSPGESLSVIRGVVSLMVLPDESTPPDAGRLEAPHHDAGRTSSGVPSMTVHTGVHVHHPLRPGYHPAIFPPAGVVDLLSQGREFGRFGLGVRKPRNPRAFGPQPSLPLVCPRTKARHPGCGEHEHAHYSQNYEDNPGD